jgi:LPS export ABC transporter protein LptC
MRARLLLLLPALIAAAACGREKSTKPTVAVNPLADSADQIMYGVTLFITADGVNKAQVKGNTAYFLESNSKIVLVPAHVVFFTKDGQENGTLDARRGTYRSSGQSMVANGDVVVVSNDGRRLQTEELKYDSFRREIASDSAFVLTEPDRRLEGVGFRSDPSLQNVRVLRVESGSAGEVSVPKP